MLKRTRWGALRDRWAKRRDSYETKAEHLTPEDLKIRIRILMSHAYDLGRRDQRAVAKLRRRPRAVFIQVGCDRHPSGPRGRVSLGQTCTCRKGRK